MRALAALLAMALAATALSGCGRKNPPKPPVGYVPKGDVSQPGEAESAKGAFKDYRPIGNHTVGNQP